MKAWLIDLAWMTAIVAAGSVLRELHMPFYLGATVGIAMAVQDIRHEW